MEVRRRIVVDRRQNATLDRVSHRRTRLDDEPIEREMVRRLAADFTAQDLVQIGSPLVDCLAGPAVDEVETDVLESCASRRGDGGSDVLRLVQPAEHAQAAPIQRLRSNAEAIHSCIEQT